ncbi:MAG TPA: sigma-54 dependent transcriptional regulator [Gemmatimonadales bacterium]|nr:sigma-54 dependent transcriptional regulator [Gemmatimonadales bacterium]
MNTTDAPRAAGPPPAAAVPPPAPALRVMAVGENPLPLGWAELARQPPLDGVRLESTTDPVGALRSLSQGGWDVLLVGLSAEMEERLAWWSEMLHRIPRRPRLMALVPAASIGLALRAARLGVFEVLSAPLGREQFRTALERVRASGDQVTLPLPDVIPTPIGSQQMISSSPAMLEVFRTIAKVAPSTATVLVLGDSGTGKELVARAIQLHGPRADGPFVAVNCAAIPDNLLESELFGHEKGAFTGAIATRRGRFERAHGGTLFLDEIADMSLGLQAKMLRAVQEQEIERVGGTEPIPVDVRVVAATNRDLPAMITQGRFREDLYYRLAVVTIQLPPLTARGDDLLLLTTHFLREFGQRYGKCFSGISEQALRLLRAHQWVGNVRELRNVIERATLLADDEVLRAEHLPEQWRTGAEAAGEWASPEHAPGTLREVEARHIARVLLQTGRQISEAARLLGVHRNTLARKIREYDL